MSLRLRTIHLLVLSVSLLAHALAQTHVSKPGVNDAKVRMPLARLKPDAVITIPGAPDWIAIGRDIWVSNEPKNNVTRIDPRKNTITQIVTGLNKPCSGLAIGFGSLWVPNCGDQTIARIDLESAKITNTIATGVADSEGGIAIGAGSVWIMTDTKGTLARIDPEGNAVQTKISLPGGCFTPEFGFDSVWVSCTVSNSVVRVDPQTNQITASIPVGPQPRFLTAGEGAVWILNQGDGSVTRISPVTNKVEATTQVGIPGEGGDISAAEGSVWATSFGFPVSRLDPTSNKVVQQFVGGGGDAIRAGGGSVWLSNYKSGTEWKLNPKRVAAVKP